MVEGPGHGVGNGCLAGVPDQVGTTGDDEEVPAEQLHELLFEIGETVTVNRVRLESEGPLLAGAHGFRKIGCRGNCRESVLVVVGGEFSRKSVGGELVDWDVVNAVDVADVCVEGKVGYVSCHDAEYFIYIINGSKKFGPKVKISAIPQRNIHNILNIPKPCQS